MGITAGKVFALLRGFSNSQLENLLPFASVTVNSDALQPELPCPPADTGNTFRCDRLELQPGPTMSQLGDDLSRYL